MERGSKREDEKLSTEAGQLQTVFHLYGGALYGLPPLASPATMFGHRSPVRGLYLAGQTTWPGFGVINAGLSGILAAELLLRTEIT
jgi:phytoene desaturase